MFAEWICPATLATSPLARAEWAAESIDPLGKDANIKALYLPHPANEVGDTPNERPSLSLSV